MPVFENKDIPRLLEQEKVDAFKDIKSMLSNYKKQREEQKQQKYNLPQQTAQMRIMNSFQAGQKPTTNHMRIPSFGGDLGNFSDSTTQ
jgi:hypothetical protein